MDWANIGRRALPLICSLIIITPLSGCDWDSNDNDATGRVPVNPTTHTVGGMVSGLASGATLTLLDNGSDPLNITANGAFTFDMPLAASVSYEVTIETQPAGQTCTVDGGAGAIGTADVVSVTVSCVDQAFTLSGTISGLGANTGLVLTNGIDTLEVPANATDFTMPTTLVDGDHYDVTIGEQPSNETCVVDDGSGIIAGADVTAIAIACEPAVSVLYSFTGAPGDGANPWYTSLLLASDGNLYGMTSSGGAYNGGTVFRITPAGTETVLWSFGNGTDGASPYGSLIQGSDGNFYGMTNLGGLYGRGTVFVITPGGVETVLSSFGNSTDTPIDGYNPYGSLIELSDGNFYGMAYGVGPTYPASVFKITPGGVRTLLWSFGSGSDGDTPYGRLTQGSDGNLYAMTYQGGVNGQGTIFRLTPGGVETVVRSFGGIGDGAHPTGSLTLGSDGNFYGMTIDGGTNNAGVVFKITPDGIETVLHSFGDSGDGQYPQGSLIQGTDGNFYGVTGLGGVFGSGTLFRITPNGTETVRWSFGANSDARSAFGDLTQGSDGTFYGLSSRGGEHDFGAVFTFK